VGASKDVDAGGGYKVGATGGANEVKLTIDEIPSHTHMHRHLPAYFNDRAGGDMAQGGGTKAEPPKWETDATGGNHPHENRPPYYALCYIMKV
jgi:microcystin-dependent protein